MAENDVTIKINLDADYAQAQIESFGRESVKVLQKTENQADNFFKTFKGGALKLTGAFIAITGGFQAIRDGINQAVEDAKLTRQIEASLQSVGDATSAAVSGVFNFAKAIQSTTGVSDDLVKQTFITAQSFGISTEKAKELTKAAIDLASATGQDVESAVRLLGGTLDGTIGKVGNYGSEFRNLTKQQLEAGAAIDLVNKKFGGSASKDLTTFQGSVNVLKNSWDDLLKSLGKVVTESTLVQDALNGIASAVDSTTEVIKDFNKTKEITISGGKAALNSGIDKDTVNEIILATKELQAFRDINVGGQSKEIAKGFAGIIDQARGASSATQDFIQRLNAIPLSQAPQTLQLTGKALEEAKKKAEEAAKAYETLLAKLKTSTASDAAKIKARYDQEIVEIKNVSKEKFLSSQQTAILIAEVEKNRIIETNKFLLDEAKKAADELRKQAEDQKNFLQGVFANPFGDLAQRFQDQLVRGIDFLKTGVDIGSPFKEGEIAASISGGIKTALEGKAGAVKAVSQVAETIGASFGIPGLGAITELLSKGPEATKKFITEFISSVPDIIQAVSESIPVVVEALVDTLINKGGIIKIAAALARALVFAPVFAKLGEKIFGVPSSELTSGITKSFSEGAANWTQSWKDFFNGIGPAFGKAILAFGPGLSDLFNNLGRDLELSFNRFDEVFNQQWNLFVKSFGSTLTSFINGIVPAFGQFFSLLGPSFESAINNFVNAITDSISSVFDPVLDYIQRFTSSLQQLQSVFSEIGRIFTDFARVFSDLFNGLSNQLAKLTDPIERLIKSLEKPFGGGGGQGLISEGAQNIGNVVTGKKKILPFSSGGLVYAADGFFAPKGTDTVPAMLTPGELVVPKDMVSQLGAFLMSQNSVTPSNDSSMLAAILSAVQSPIVIKTEAKVNQQAFADIILQLNRQNARLRA
jgi:hypothetical protein